MIDEETVDLLVERLIRRIELMNTYFLMEMGSSIKKIKKLTPSEAQKLVQILKYGGNYEEMIQELSKYTGLNVKDLDKIFKAYAKKDQMFYKDFYEYRNKPFIPFDENVVLQRQTEALKNIASQEMYNFTRSNVLGYTISDLDGTQRFFGLRETYNRVLDDALLSVSQGKETFNSSMSRIMKEIGGSGLKTLNYESGRFIRLDSAIRMQLKSRLRELHNENQKIIGEEIGADGVEITVHENPAPDHTDAQGKQFSNEEYEKLQTIGVAKTYDGKQINMHLDLKRTMATRLSFRPISEMNCYHRVYSIILGVSKPTYSNKELNDIKKRNIKGFDFDDKHYTMYEGTQLQRNLERKIREQKDIQIFAKASGNMELVDEAQHKITQLTNKYKELSNVSGLPLKKDRLLVSGYKRTKVTINEKERIHKNTNNKIVKDKIYSVDWDYVKNDEYKEKFNKISSNKKFNNQIYDEAIKILNHRDKSNGEDLTYFDYDKKTLIGRQTNMKTPRNAEPTTLMKNSLNKDIRIISIHNHPSSNPPSDFDLNSCWEKKYYKGINICHDGKVVVYNTGKNFKKIDNLLFEMTIAKYKKLGYNEYEAQVRTLNDFKKTNDFKFEVL